MRALYYVFYAPAWLLMVMAFGLWLNTHQLPWMLISLALALGGLAELVKNRQNELENPEPTWDDVIERGRALAERNRAAREAARAKQSEL